MGKEGKGEDRRQKKKPKHTFHLLRAHPVRAHPPRRVHARAEVLPAVQVRQRVQVYLRSA